MHALWSVTAILLGCLLLSLQPFLLLRRVFLILLLGVFGPTARNSARQCLAGKVSDLGQIKQFLCRMDSSNMGHRPKAWHITSPEDCRKSDNASICFCTISCPTGRFCLALRRVLVPVPLPLSVLTGFQQENQKLLLFTIDYLHLKRDSYRASRHGQDRIAKAISSQTVFSG